MQPLAMGEACACEHVRELEASNVFRFWLNLDLFRCKDGAQFLGLYVICTVLIEKCGHRAKFFKDFNEKNGMFSPFRCG